MPKSIVLNRKAVAYIKKLINAGRVVSGPFTWAASDKQAILGNPPHWGRYAQCFLGIDKRQAKGTEARYKYVVAKVHMGKVYVFKNALRNRASRASAQHLPDISKACSDLLALINKKNLSAKPHTLHIVNLPDGKWRLYSKDKGADGKHKILGTFDTKAEAEKQERAVEYYKHQSVKSMSAKGNRQIHLFTPVDTDKIKVDQKAGTIDNVAVMTIGPARGHVFWIDATTLAQAMEFMKDRQNRNRFTHPMTPGGLPKDDTGTLVGHITNPRIDGETLRGTVTLGAFAHNTPGLGDVWAYLIGTDENSLGVIQTSPQDIGLSAVIHIEEEPRSDENGQPLLPAGRVKQLSAIDWVSEPAANPAGLLSVGTGQVVGSGDQATIMTPELVKILVSDFGLDPKSNVNAAGEFFSGLPMEKQADAIDKVSREYGDHNMARLKAHQQAAHEAMKADLEKLAEKHGAKLGKGDSESFARKLASSVKAPEGTPDEPDPVEPEPTATDPDPVDPDATTPEPEDPDGGEPDPTEPDPENLDADGDTAIPGAGGGEDDTETVKTKLKSNLKKLAASHGLAASEKDLEEMAGKMMAKKALSRRIDPGTAMVNKLASDASNIRRLGKILQTPDDVILQAIREGKDIKGARQMFLANASQSNGAIKHLSVGNDLHRVALKEAFPQALMLRAGTKIDKPHAIAEQYKNLTLCQIGRQYMLTAGLDCQFWPDHKVAVAMLHPESLRNEIGYSRWVSLAESVGDFPGILKDAINKRLQVTYKAQPTTWAKWCRKGEARDFKGINRPNLSDIGALTQRNPGQPIQYQPLTDTNEIYVLQQFAEGIMLTWQAIINDDKSAFSTIPERIASRCATLEDQTAYGVLTGNANMADGVAIFATGHKNTAGAVAAISVSTLGTAYASIQNQTAPQGMKLGLQPRILLVPPEIFQVAFSATSQNLIATTITSGSPVLTGSQNPWANRFELISTPYLSNTGGNATNWFLACSAGDNQIETVEVSFLEGEPEPVVKQETAFDTDDLKIAVRHTLAAKALNYRGLYQGSN